MVLSMPAALINSLERFTTTYRPVLEEPLHDAPTPWRRLKHRGRTSVTTPFRRYQ